MKIARFPGTGERGPGKSDDSKKQDSACIRSLQVTEKSLTLGNLRVIWWSQWRQGHRLPAERGVILIDGGKR